MRFTAVLPSIYPPWTEACLTSMCSRFYGNTLVVNNQSRNIGVSASWNRGRSFALHYEDDWLVILSACLRFGAPGGADFLGHLMDVPDNVVAVQARDVNWHLIAFPAFVLEEVGKFDPVFFAYCEDVDYMRRIGLIYGLDVKSTAPPEIPEWVTADIDVECAGIAHGVTLGGAVVDNVATEAAYVAKHGAMAHGETFLTPYDDPTLDWTFTGARP